MYCVVNIDTGCKIIIQGRKENYSRFQDAKKFENFLKTKGIVSTTIMTVEQYEKQVPMKTVRCLMTGANVSIRADTPLHCDPSSETYWSM